MPFTTTDQHIRKAEVALGVRFPASLRERLQRDNGGEIEAADDIWQLFPVQDTTDRKRLSRTANHIVRETTEARKWDGFPSTAVAIASNGSGDYLILQDTVGDGVLDDIVLLWTHDDASASPVDVTWQP